MIMNNQTTINKLIEIRLSVMADAFRLQNEDPSFRELSFEERLGLLVDAEYTARKNNRLRRLIRSATFDQSHANIADINYRANRKLNKSQIHQFASCEYILEAHNIILMGATGSGKSYLACALGMEACKKMLSVKYIRLPELLADLAFARVQGEFKKAINQYRKVKLLIIDEWMLVSLTETEARDVLEIIHHRHKRGSIILCSQFAPAGWHNKIGEATIADAILDRIVHDSYSIEIHSDPRKDEHSMREYYGLKANQI
jgi:DNA replication protein DnaC